MTSIAIPDQLSDGVALVRPFTADDLPSLVRIVADPEIRDRNHVPEPTDEAVSEWLQTAWRRAAEGAAVQFAVCDAATGQLAGRRGLRIDAQARRASVGCWLDPQWRGRRLAPRSARLVAAWAFEHWPVDRIGAECDTDNHASYRSLTAAGFQVDGLLRSYSLGNDGRRRDQYAFSLLPADLAAAARL